MGEINRSKNKKLSFRSATKRRIAPHCRMPASPKRSNPDDFIRWAYAVCAIVVSQYLARSKSPHQKRRSANDLHSIMNEISEINGRGKIEIKHRRKTGAKNISLLALVMRKPGAKGQVVFVIPSKKHSEIRVAYVQESFQALLDDSRLRSRSLSEALWDYLDFLRNRSVANITSKTKPTYGEFIAELVAVEALFPYQDRVQIRKGTRVSALTQKKIQGLAKKYGIPTRCVRHYLRDDIMKELGKYHKHENKPKKATRRVH